MWLKEIGTPSSEITRAEFRNQRDINEYSIDRFAIRKYPSIFLHYTLHYVLYVFTSITFKYSFILLRKRNNVEVSYTQAYTSTQKTVSNL